MASIMKLEGSGKVAILLVMVILCWASAQILVCAQTGFISIDCGAASNYVHPSTGISYVTDADYITTGRNANVANLDGATSADLTSSTLRYFPDQRSKNCYSLPVKAGTRYLVKASFHHGGYDGTSAPVSFGISVDTVSVALVINSLKLPIELVGLTLSDTLFICLIRVNPKETPFISSLEYRPLEDFMYQGLDGDARNYGIALNARYHFRTAKQNIRYPDDVYDRTWLPYDKPLDNTVTTIETTQKVSTTAFLSPNLPPSVVMQSALTCPVNSVLSICVPIIVITSTSGLSSFYLTIHIAELQEIAVVQPRIFNVSRNGGNIWFRGVQPLAAAKSLYSSTSFGWYKFNMSGSEVCVAFQAEANSTLGPLINAIEFYTILLGGIPPFTNNSDTAIIEDLKTSLNLTDWTGDPCLPIAYNWLTCSKDKPPTVETVILSNYGTGGPFPSLVSALFNLTTLRLDGNALTGEIPDLSPLVNLRRLHLQNNSLSGVIPESLANIPLLEELFLENNNLSGEVPAALLEKTHLKFRYFGNPSLCRNISCPFPPTGSSSASGRKIWVIAVAAGGGALLLLIGLWLIIILICGKSNQKNITTDYQAVYELYPRRGNINTPNELPERDLDIVFFHGLQSSANGQDRPWEATWTNGAGDCWPRDWLPLDEKLRNKTVRVLSVSYNAQVSGHATGNFGVTADSHSSISEALFHSLVTGWRVGTAPFVLVGFGYGGLVIQSLVVHCKKLQSNHHNTEASNFMRNLRGIVSYDVPFLGTKMARPAKIKLVKCLFSLSRLVDTLNPFNRENARLSSDFKGAIQRLDVKRRAFAAGSPTLYDWRNVPRTSAQGDHTYEEFTSLTGTNHDSMCKPNGRNAEAYDMFVIFLRDKIIGVDNGLCGAVSPPTRASSFKPDSTKIHHITEHVQKLISFTVGGRSPRGFCGTSAAAVR